MANINVILSDSQLSEICEALSRAALYYEGLAGRMQTIPARDGWQEVAADRRRLSMGLRRMKTSRPAKTEAPASVAEFVEDEGTPA